MSGSSPRAWGTDTNTKRALLMYGIQRKKPFYSSKVDKKAKDEASCDNSKDERFFFILGAILAILTLFLLLYAAFVIWWIYNN